MDFDNFSKRGAKFVILFDGECPMCNYWVKLVLKRDKENEFLISPLTSDFSQEFLTKNHLPTSDFNTLYLVQSESKYLEKSRAIFEICHQIGGIYKWISWLKFLPKSWTDSVYNLISRNRKKIYSNSCPRIPKEYLSKFV